MMRYREAKRRAHGRLDAGWEANAFQLASGRWVVLQYQTRHAELTDSVWKEPVWKDVE